MSLTVWDGITVGAVGGAIAGLTVWFFQWARKKISLEWDKRKVYNWLYEKTKKGKGLTIGSPINDPRWISTDVIACYTYLPKERIRYICSIHKKIRAKMESDLWKNEKLDEKWAIREFVKLTEP